MRVTIVVALVVTALLAACEKDRAAPPPKKTAPVTAGAVGADGVRRIPVTASNKGYDPAEITARPNEKLIMVVTRTVEGECLSQIRVGDGPVIDLPMNTAVDVPITAPATGTIRFACGMDMFSGTIAVGG